MAKVFETQEDGIPMLSGIWGQQPVEKAIEVIIAKDGERIVSSPINLSEMSGVIRNALPGRYTIKLRTGRVLWEDEITKKDLLWHEAFPDRELKLAAATGEAKRVSTKKISVLDGEIIIRVFPGFEDGTIEVKRSK